MRDLQLEHEWESSIALAIERYFRSKDQNPCEFAAGFQGDATVTGVNAELAKRGLAFTPNEAFVYDGDKLRGRFRGTVYTNVEGSS